MRFYSEPTITISIIIVASHVIGLSELVDWKLIKDGLKGNEWRKSALDISRNWLERPKNFFQEIDKESWERIIPFLSKSKFAMIQKDELALNRQACEAFAKYLPFMSNPSTFPQIFRLEVYNFLRKNSITTELGGFTISSPLPSQVVSHDDDGDGPWLTRERRGEALDMDESPSYHQPPSLNDYDNSKSRMIKLVIKSIPEEWILQDASIVTEILVSSKPPRLELLNDVALSTLLKNPDGVCNLINVNAIERLSPTQAKYVKPQCMASIKYLDKLDLWNVLFTLSDDIFAAYNGHLSRTTIKQLSGKQLENYGSFLDSSTTILCKSLDLHYTLESTIRLVTARCLHGYLSQKGGRKLGSSWKVIPLNILMQFTSEMQIAWMNIHYDDFPLMSPVMSSLILTSINPKLAPEFLPLSLSNLSLNNNDDGATFEFGSEWQKVSPATIISLKNNMASKLGKVSINDMKFMPEWVLQAFLTLETVLENLSKFPESIFELPDSARGIIFSREQFATVAKLAPNLAGQLLLVMNKVPVDIFAECEASVIRSLKWVIPGKMNLDWKLLIGKMKEKWNSSIDGIIDLMSIASGKHFCSTINNFKEYLSLSWLRHSRREACLNVIGLDLNNIFILSQAPELLRKNFPWKLMLKNYSLEDWTRVLNHESFYSSLEDDCEFWSQVNNNYQSILSVIQPEFLKRISFHCIYRLKESLSLNVKVIPYLSDDSFAMYRVNELPCEILKDLSPGQIAKLSMDTIVDFTNPTVEELFEHALSAVTLEELNSLSYQQFKSLLTMQWTYVPEKVKFETLEWHFNKFQTFINGLVKVSESKDGGGEWIYDLDLPEGVLQTLKTFKDALEFYDAILTSDLLKLKESLNWDGLVSAINNSLFRENFVEIFLEFPWAEPLVFALARNDEDLRLYMTKSMETTDDAIGWLELSLYPGRGFDRGEVLHLLENSPESFAHPNSFIDCEETCDHGGLMRMLVGQLLGDIERDLIVMADPLSTNRLPLLEIENQASTSENFKVSTLNNYSKFVWGTSREVGFIFGLVFGKAFQLGIKLPFILHSEFYSLLIHPDDKAIESFYYLNYGGEKLDFERNVLRIRESSYPFTEELENILPRLDCLSFTKLSLKNDMEAAKLDHDRKTNIKNCKSNEGFHNNPDLARVDYLEDYLESHHRLVMAEFNAFIRQVVRGLDFSLPPLKQFERAPFLAQRRIISFLPIIMNSAPLAIDNFIDHVEFKGDQEVESFIKGQTVLASKVFSAFIRALELEQLENLIALWTGASSISIKHANLRVEFSKERSIEGATFDFCKPEELVTTASKRGTIIAPGQEYLLFFKRMTQGLFGLDTNIQPDCPAGGLPLTVIQVSICGNCLFIALKPAQELLNNLVDLLNSPLNFIRDF